MICIRPSTYILSLVSTNEPEFEEQLFPTTIKAITDTVVVLEANLSLPIKTLWDVVVYAYGCKENVLADGIELSKLM